MDIKSGLELIQHAFDMEDEEKLYSRWLVGPQFKMSFEDFKRELMPPVFKSDSEILADVENIMNGGAKKHGNI